MKRKALTSALLLGLAAAAAGTGAPIYRLEHAQRPPEFTDRPPNQGLAPVTLGTPSPFPDQRPQARPETPPTEVPKLVESAAAAPSVAIVSPGPGEAIRANNGAVPLALALNPALDAGEQLRLLLDGVELMTTKAPRAVLEGMARGEHTLVVQRLSAEGRLLAEAERTFYVLRTALGRTP